MRHYLRRLRSVALPALFACALIGLAVGAGLDFLANQVATNLATHITNLQVYADHEPRATLAYRPPGKTVSAGHPYFAHHIVLDNNRLTVTVRPRTQGLAVCERLAKAALVGLFNYHVVRDDCGAEAPALSISTRVGLPAGTAPPQRVVAGTVNPWWARLPYSAPWGAASIVLALLLLRRARRERTASQIRPDLMPVLFR